MQKREERQVVNRPARIELGDGTAFQCRIANVSRGGALLLVPDSDLLPMIFYVTDSHENTRREVRNVWTAPGRVGVSYVDIDNGHFGKPVKTQVTFGRRGGVS